MTTKLLLSAEENRAFYISDKSLFRYGFPLFLLIAVSLASDFLSTYTNLITNYLLYSTVIIFTIKYCGIKPAIFTGFIAVVISVYLFKPAKYTYHENLLQVVLFIINCLSIIILGKHIQALQGSFSITKQQFKTFIEKSPDGFAIVNPQGKFLYINPAVEKLLGYSSAELIQADTQLYKDHNEQLELETRFKEVLEQEGKSVQFTHRYHHKQGHWLWIETTLTNQLSEPGIEAIICNLKDVTDKVVHEKQKNDFLNIASLEIKDPLNHLSYYTNLIRKEFTNTNNVRLQNILERMQLQIQRAGKVIEDLANAPEAKQKHQYSYSYFDFNDLLIDTVDDLNTRTTTHTINTHLATIPTMLGDKERLRQAIIHLISNAVRYSPHSNTVKVISRSVHNTLKLEVIDYGAGIDKTDHQNVFKRFYRSQQNHSGIGLGLYTTAQIIRRHNGSIGFQSETGKGSSFWFTLPLNP